jgi:hypothetical protein
MMLNLLNSLRNLLNFIFDHGLPANSFNLLKIYVNGCFECVRDHLILVRNYF